MVGWMDENEYDVIYVCFCVFREEEEIKEKTFMHWLYGNKFMLIKMYPHSLNNMNLYY